MPMSWLELKAAAGVGLIPLGVLSQSMGIRIVYYYLYVAHRQNMLKVCLLVDDNMKTDLTGQRNLACRQRSRLLDHIVDN